MAARVATGCAQPPDARAIDARIEAHDGDNEALGYAEDVGVTRGGAS